MTMQSNQQRSLISTVQAQSSLQPNFSERILRMYQLLCQNFYFKNTSEVFIGF